MAKVDQIENLLERRIAQGDYLTRELPAEERLALETGVSRMTARKAVLRLLERGVVARGSNGRVYALSVETKKGETTKQIALLKPAWASPSTSHWHGVMNRIAPNFSAGIRSFDFVHWDDPVIADVLDAGARGALAGLFLLPSSEPIPSALRDKLASADVPVVAIASDLSGHGIRSIDTTPADAFHPIFDHLHSIGCARIDLINTQPLDQLINRRMDQWAIWRAAMNIPGEAFVKPVPNYCDPMKRAYDLGKTLADRFRNPSPQGKRGIFCTTTSAAVGLIRALIEAGIDVGRDVAVSGADDEGFARYTSPTITTLKPADPGPYLKHCLDWMTGPSKRWVGPLLMRPADVPLVIGESTAGKNPTQCA